MSLPNLVIAGAPKCGTSSVFTWLADHPQVCGAKVKETFYLMDKGHPKLKRDSNVHDHGLEGYKAYFDHCQSCHTIVVEATTHYLYQQTARAVLSRLVPTPHILFMLRKPSDRVYSSFHFTQNNLANLDKRISFSQYVEMVRDGSADALLAHFSSPASAYVLLNDIKYSQYIDYLSLWLKHFDRQHIHVLLFESMRQNPRVFMFELAGRLGIDANFYLNYEFTKRNETITIRSQHLHRRARNIAQWLPKGILKRVLKQVYLHMQTDSRKGIALEDRVALTELEAYFHPFNQRLAAEFDLDLSSWA